MIKVAAFLLCRRITHSREGYNLGGVFRVLPAKRIPFALPELSVYVLFADVRPEHRGILNLQIAAVQEGNELLLWQEAALFDPDPSDPRKETIWMINDLRFPVAGSYEARLWQGDILLDIAAFEVRRI